MRAVLGVDGCRAGWIGVRWDGATVEVAVAAGIAELVASLRPVAVVAIDIPIGLPDALPREAENVARAALPGRAATVFNAPAASAVDAPTYAEANRANRDALGLGLSRQSFALFPAIRDVRDWLAGGASEPVVEAHPELSFAALAGAVVPHPKRTAEGGRRRRELLTAAGLTLPATAPRGAGTDDLLDAAAVAWTARRVLEGTAVRRPAHPREPPAPAIWT